MKINQDKFIAARKASGMTLDKASELAGISKPTYVGREKHPEQFRLCELSSVYNELTPTAKPIMHDAIMDIFLP